MAGCKARQTILIICPDIVTTTSQSFTWGAAAMLNNSLLNSSLGFFSIILVTILHVLECLPEVFDNLS